MCGIDDSSSQWCSWIFILCYTHLNLALLLHKQGLVATGAGTTIKIFLSAQFFKVHSLSGKLKFLPSSMPNNDDDGDKLGKESVILSKSQNCFAVSLYFF